MARRTGLQVIEDAFFDLPVPDQKQLLGTLATLHRMKQRIAEDEPEAKRGKRSKPLGEATPLPDGQPAAAPEPAGTPRSGVVTNSTASILEAS